MCCIKSTLLFIFLNYTEANNIQKAYTRMTIFSWAQEDRISDIGEGADTRESVLSVHACFLIKSMSRRDEHVRDVSVKLLTQLKEKFPQVGCFGLFGHV
jgi:hypothetical protein